MQITSIAPWFGAKRSIASEIIMQLGPHQSYWEPFCGSMAVLLAKQPSRSETVNDLHGPLTTLARVLASDDARILYDRLQRTLMCEGLFNEVRQSMADGKFGTDLDIAFAFFVESWMGRNGIAGTRTNNTSFCVRFTSDGGDPATRFRNAVDSIPEWHHRLRSVVILNRDAFEILDRIEDKQDTVIYCDPPYLTKNARYVHDFSDEHHKRLAESVSRFRKTKVVVSYYDDPALSWLYPAWNKLYISATKLISNSNDRNESGRVNAPEVLLINKPAETRHPDLFPEDTKK